MKIINRFSPNFDKKNRPIAFIKILVIHYTGMQSERESIARLSDPKFKVSSHFVIGQKGNVYRLVEVNKVAWHAGKSCWGKYKNLNKNSIGIELVNKGHQFGYTSFKKRQISSLIKLCKTLIKKYKIKSIVGHSDIAPLRKKDPGEKFPWEKLAKKKIGFWHSYKSKELIKFRRVKILKKSKFEFIKNLVKIGYCFEVKKKSNFTKTIKAFQMRFRKKLVNGIIDKECLLIAQNLSKKI